MELSEKDYKKLEGVDEELKRLVEAVSKRSELTFIITEGIRSQERQKELYEAKKSKTLNSKHLTGDAVDIGVIVDGKLTWDKKYYDQMGELFEETAKELNIPFRWGGRFKNFYDGPHQELMK